MLHQYDSIQQRVKIEELKTNRAYRLFLGNGFHDSASFLSFRENHERRFKASIW